MLCLSGFELYSRWVPLRAGRVNEITLNNHEHLAKARTQ